MQRMSEGRGWYDMIRSWWCSPIRCRSVTENGRQATLGPPHRPWKTTQAAKRHRQPQLKKLSPSDRQTRQIPRIYQYTRSIIGDRWLKKKKKREIPNQVNNWNWSRLDPSAARTTSFQLIHGVVSLVDWLIDWLINCTVCIQKKEVRWISSKQLKAWPSSYLFGSIGSGKSRSGRGSNTYVLISDRQTKMPNAGGQISCIPLLCMILSHDTCSDFQRLVNSQVYDMIESYSSIVISVSALYNTDLLWL